MANRKNLLLFVAYLLVIINIVFIQVYGNACPNACSGHGDCNSADNRCKCWKADPRTNTFWIGGDCSLRECPRGPAWVDMAIANENAHNVAEWSNKGTCDYTTGHCTCELNFEGVSCNRMTCELDCNGHGACRSMKFHSDAQTPENGKTYYAYTNVWDANMIYGCACDVGYTGHDCSIRLCPTGDDPMTTGQVDEVQIIQCVPNNAAPQGTGYFTLTYKGQTTAHIPADGDNSDIQKALNALTTITAVTVSFPTINGIPKNMACESNIPQFLVTFTEDFSNLPMLTATSSTNAITVDEQTGGTKEESLCAGRGICDFGTGICKCSANFKTSNGLGAAGTRGECGFATGTITACPGEISCSGHGVCAGNPTYVCQCSNGWMGADCSLRVCPSGPAWFGPPTATDTAHDLQECSNIGLCERSKGECVCRVGWNGAACQYKSCPGSPACTGHGQCVDMKTLAGYFKRNGEPAPNTYGLTPNDNLHWDEEEMYGCSCDDGFTGYDCSQRMCPFGDDPYTLHQENHQRVLKCTGTSGTFKIKFRGEITLDINAFDTKDQMKEKLEAIKTIDSVQITFTDSTAFTVCTSGGTNVVIIKFLSQTGGSPWIDQFLRRTTTSPPKIYLEDVANTITIALGQDTVTKSFEDPTGATDEANNKILFKDINGTKEFNTCSDRGLCSYALGTCSCFKGYGSSDGQGKEGKLGECGYVEPYITAQSG